LGLLILLLAGDALVKGAVPLSLRSGIPALIVSLTIVAFGTSAPELLISITAALEHKPGIALGNVLGSNTANVLMVLGIPALIATMKSAECESRRSYLQMLVGSLLFIFLAFCGVFTWVSGVILLSALSFILFSAAREAKKHIAAGEHDDLEDPEGADPDMAWWKIVVYLVLGLIGLPLGAELLLESSVTIARMFGITETVIGLTLVAIGTSLPELATTVMAVIRRQADVAIGNVIGSNMFNLLAIVGVTAVISPIPVDPELLEFDVWVMLGATLLLIPFVFFRFNITRPWGVLLTILYVTYIVTVLD
jgi:cation:H+ antiporter